MFYVGSSVSGGANERASGCGSWKALAISCNREQMRNMWDIRDRLHLATFASDVFWIIGLKCQASVDTKHLSGLHRLAVDGTDDVLYLRNPLVRKADTMDLPKLGAWVDSKCQEYEILSDSDDIGDDFGDGDGLL